MDGSIIVWIIIAILIAVFLYFWKKQVRERDYHIDCLETNAQVKLLDWKNEQIGNLGNPKVNEKKISFLQGLMDEIERGIYTYGSRDLNGNVSGSPEYYVWRVKYFPERVKRALEEGIITQEEHDYLIDGVIDPKV